MHHHIQRGKIRSQVINVPEGFPELLSDITREVLRCQPTTECLCQFVIDYLHSIIVTRDKARIAQSIIDRALRTVDEIIDDMCICNITKAKADQMSDSMEECFKRFLAKRRCEKGVERPIIQFNERDMLDELINKCKFSEDDLKISRPVIEAAYQKFVDAYMLAQENAEGTECMYQYFLDREIKRAEQIHREAAAIKIQASYRGFTVRKTMLFDKSIIPESRLPSQINDDLHHAARKIQIFYRRRMDSKKSAIGFEPEIQDICNPVSNVTLTLHPAGHQNHEPEDGDQQATIDPDEQPPDEEAQDKDHVGDATVEEVNVEKHHSAEEITVQFEIDQITEEVDLIEVIEENIAPDEAQAE